jgi:hypothetical protein
MSGTTAVPSLNHASTNNKAAAALTGDKNNGPFVLFNNEDIAADTSGGGGACSKRRVRIDNKESHAGGGGGGVKRNNPRGSIARNASMDLYVDEEEITPLTEAVRSSDVEVINSLIADLSKLEDGTPVAELESRRESAQPPASKRESSQPPPASKRDPSQQQHPMTVRFRSGTENETEFGNRNRSGSRASLCKDVEKSGKRHENAANGSSSSAASAAANPTAATVLVATAAAEHAKAIGGDGQVMAREDEAGAANRDGEQVRKWEKASTDTCTNLCTIPCTIPGSKSAF